MLTYPSFPAPSKDKLKVLIVKTIKLDDEWAFVMWMRALLKYHRVEGNVYTTEFSMELLKNICLHRAVKCATCLLEGDCRLKVDDLNVAVEGGLPPLHLAARDLCYDLTKLFSLYGAHPNLCCICDHHKEKLPLCFALEALSNHQLVTSWSLDKSLYTLIYIFYLKEMVEPFNTISFLASRTTREHLEKISLRYAEEGEVVKLTALLLVAWDTLVSPYAEQGIECCPIGQCIRKEIQSLSDEQEMNGSKRELLHERKTKLEAAWKMLELLWETYDGLDEYRYGLRGPCAKKNAKEIFNHQVPLNVARSMGNFHPECMEDVFAGIECFKPGLQPKEKGLLDEALQNQMCSGSASVWVPPLARMRKGVAASFCGARPFHTSSKFNLRKELKGQLVAAKVEKPSFRQLPTFRMCTLLVNIAKRGFK